MLHVSLELRPKTSETVSGAYKWRQTVPNSMSAAREPTRSNVYRWRLCWQSWGTGARGPPRLPTV